MFNLKNSKTQLLWSRKIFKKIVYDLGGGSQVKCKPISIQTHKKSQDGRNILFFKLQVIRNFPKFYENSIFKKLQLIVTKMT